LLIRCIVLPLLIAAAASATDRNRHDRPCRLHLSERKADAWRVTQMAIAGLIVAIRSFGLCFVLAAAVLALFTVSQAEAENGYSMLPACQMLDDAVSHNRRTPEASEDAFREGMCLGQVVGIAQLGNAATKTTDFPICKPSNVPRGQLVSVVLLYLRNHPEELNKDFMYLVMAALRAAWPCK
jgi:Rap1a immunity proteins